MSDSTTENSKEEGATQDDTQDEPNVLDTESEEDGGKVASDSIGHGSDIHATRDEEVVAKALSGSRQVADDQDEDEIETARAELRETEEDDEDDDPEEDESEGSADKAYFQRTIERAHGKPVSKMENLKLHLTGNVVLSVSDRKEGYLFSWKDEALQVENWEGKKPSGAKCEIELGEKDLELILRGRLNPQVAMLSHKVDVKGDLSHAVYFFNLFSSGRK